MHIKKLEELEAAEVWRVLSGFNRPQIRRLDGISMNIYEESSAHHILVQSECEWTLAKAIASLLLSFYEKRRSLIAHCISNKITRLATVFQMYAFHHKLLQ